RVPEVGVDPAEEVTGLVVPRPAQVERELFESRQLVGEGRAHGEAAEGLHRPRTVAAESPGCAPPPPPSLCPPAVPPVGLVGAGPPGGGDGSFDRIMPRRVASGFAAAATSVHRARSDRSE